MPTSTSSPRVRRATDVVRAVVAALGFLLLSSAVESGALGLDPWTDVVGALPSWVVQLFVAVVVTALLVLLFVVTIALTQVRSDVSFLRDLAVVVVATIAGAWVVSLAIAETAVQAGVIDPARSPLLDYPDLFAAVNAAVVVAAVPHVARPNRRLLWAFLLITTGCATLTDPAALAPVIAGFLLGLLVASAWLALVGSPAGLPDMAAVRAALARSGLQVTLPTVDRPPLWGGAVTCLADRSHGGGRVRIKVYGRDAVAADFWVRLYQRITYLDPQRSWSARGIDLVEHEAAVTAVAQQSGVPVTPIAAVSDWHEADPFLAVDWTDTSLADLDEASVTAALVADLWRTVIDLHAGGVVHGSLSAASFRFDAGVVRLADLDRARFSTDRRLQDRDLANLLVILGALVGAGRAIDDARRSLGPERLDDLAPYLEPAAIRVAVPDPPGGLKALLRELRDGICELTGTPTPPPAVLKRLTARRLVAMALVVLAVVAMSSALAGIDFAAVAEEVADATWILVLLAVIVGQLVLIAEALATTSLVPERLPFGPLLALQSSMRFLGLAVPGPAARVAANTAFLRKQGVVVSRSLTLGVVDSASGLLVELGILICAAVVGDLSLALFGIEPIDVNWALITWVLLAVIAAAVLILRFVTPVRTRAATAWAGVREVLELLKESPGRTTALVATNLTARLISAAALWLVLQSLGVSLDFLIVVVVIAASNLLSGLIPVPGNVGVAEAALTAFLVAAGVPEDTAFAAAVVYRVCVAYLPPFWGAAAQRWLLRHDYL